MGIINSQLTTGPLDVIQDGLGSNDPGVPLGKTYGIVGITVCNTYDPEGPDFETRSARFSLHLMPSNKTYAGNANETMVLNNVELLPGETYLYTSGKIVLEEGETLIFVSDPETPDDPGSGLTDLVVTVSYLEV